MGSARQFITFALTGGVAASVNLVSRFALSQVVVYEVAVPVAYLIGMGAAFLLFRRYVFPPSGRHWTAEFGKFAGVNAVAFVQVWVVSVVLVRLVFPALRFGWHPEEVGHFIGVASPILSSYYGHKHFSFRSSES